MITQRWKDRWYSVWSPVLRLNLYYHRLIKSRSIQDSKVNIGCGRTQFQGWINIDGNFLRHPDIWLDVRYGLPFQSESIKVINSCHFFEHFYLDELRPLLAECRRVLRKDGGLRVAVPNLRTAIEAYNQGRTDWFCPFPVKFRTLGGQFFNDMLCDDQHRMMFDFDFLAEILADAGFQNIYEVRRGESQLLKNDDAVLAHEIASGGKDPDPWLLAEATP